MSKKNSKETDSGWFLLVLALTIVSATGIAFLAHSGDTQLEKLISRKKNLQKRNVRLKEKHTNLQIRRQRLHQDPQLIKKLAREKLGLVKPGEKVIWFKKPEDYLKEFDLKEETRPETVFENSRD